MCEICCFKLAFVFCRRCRLHRKVEPSVLLGELPGVSIVKPLMGIDPFLETNLESHFLMNYPKVQFPLIFYAFCLPLQNVATLKVSVTIGHNCRSRISCFETMSPLLF